MAELVQDDQGCEAQEGEQVGHGFECGRRFGGPYRDIGKLARNVHFTGAFGSAVADSGGRAGSHELARGPAGTGIGVAQRVEGMHRLGSRSSPSVSSITAAMSRKRRRPARNACTATSLAAFSVHGAVPPASAASRARRRQANVSSSAGSKVSAPSGDEIERRQRDLDPLRIVEGVGDRAPACPDSRGGRAWLRHTSGSGCG